jgi:head-tail adaptor
VFKVNYRTEYTTQMRVLHDGTYYGITHINQVNGMRRELELLVTS